MRLTNKSPYSATANSSFHLFVHAIGCANARPRSVNARMVGEVNVGDILANAGMLNHVRGTRSCLQPQFFRGPDSVMAPPTPAQVAAQAQADQADRLNVNQAGEEQLEAEPTENHPHAWWAYLSGFSGVVPENVMQPLYVAWSLIPNPRPGTVGEFLKTIGSRDCVRR